MLKNSSRTVLWLCGLLAVIACLSSVKGQAQTIKSPVPGIEHVVLIGADGFGAHYLKWDELPNLKELKDNGAWTVKMRSVLPSASAINWASILMGAPSEVHGYRTWGSKVPDLPPLTVTDKGKFPCIFSVLRDQYPNAFSAAVYSWDGIGYLYENADVNKQGYFKTDDEVVAKGIEFLAGKPALAFIYFHEPDTIGHKIGWGTPEYQKMMTTIDTHVGKILAYLRSSGLIKTTLVVFISDHGGTGKRHGEGIMQHMEVPWILYGPGVKKGELKDCIVNYDNAATIAWVLGLKAPQVWRGQAIRSAFDVKDK
ncbi:MAG: alkaline phosphatase [Thermoguttaceae bacterium]|nr:alkaline phosphatase [Thermoguttaceae bacterium]